MNIQSQINAFQEQYEEAKQLFPCITGVWFEINEIPYNDFISYCEQNEVKYQDRDKRLSAIAKTDLSPITVWLYTKKLNIKKTIEVEELETVDNP